MSGAEGLLIRGLTAAFGKQEVLRGVDLAVAPGETVVLFGPSGAGKTVLLRAVAGLERAGGEVWVAGREVAGLPPEARGLGMAFQNFALYPHLPARENIASPLRARRLPEAEITRRVGAVAALLRIGHVLDHAPRELSNGQKQRTALARALAAEPRALLLDDPLRNVDAKLRYEMRLELPRLLARSGAAAIYVTQDYREAMALGHRVAVLLDGRIAQDAAPDEVYDRPATVEVARLFGDPPINLLPAESMPGGRLRAAGLELPLPDDLGALPPDAQLGLRPEHLSLLPSSTPGAAPVSVVAVTPLHERQVVLLRAASGEELVASLPGAAPPVGAAVWAAAERGHALLFSGGRRIAHGARREVAVA
jgi:multiple sugar transport system ATP-binding protein